jgi:hypothetical protein
MAQLRRDVDFADQRRLTDPSAFPAHWYIGAPEICPEIGESR